ncbi:MAG: response regulator [Deltaproteobacteria bacterium]|nr:response regulator [Deltaproteobacteria bacterium]
MPSVLIADSSKSSVVMTSEVVKDHIQGVVTHVVGTGKDFLEQLGKNTYDLVIIDFDLPDADGASLAKLVRQTFHKPILITAFEDDVVQEAIQAELFFYEDACSWIRKPIVTEDFVSKLEKFLIKRHRLLKRFDTNLATEVQGKHSGRSKKQKTVKGKIVNISLGGVGVTTSEPIQGKIGDELTLTLALAGRKKVKRGPAREETKIKARLVWTDSTKKKAGFQFFKLSAKTLKSIEHYLRSESGEN